ncbi:amidohydrolase family protein [Caulobacter sp. 17J65-9]|uniref:metal-dependent hydrolase family protein n=1 Tax=Caulobacter sp. 17J65-9 TaxID=2709382 RepID=UPI0013CA4D91|nr:amidohydrolase family protein [Caulobacter sp. 17J65-9]NEX92278.1 amidohydrolase family protein [Caulobacter sp. 17J65-9]
MVDTTRRSLFGGLAAAGLFGLVRPALAEDDLRVDAPAAPPPPSGATVFRNVRVFDGRGEALSGPTDVLVRAGMIEKIGAGLPPIADAAEIAGGGRVLMPGLIDCHWHAFMAGTPQAVLMTADMGYLNLVAARQAQATLLRGFTTIRDMGGPVFGLKRAIDDGVMVGPRIYPSGAMISQTSGHGDFRFGFELPRSPGGPLSNSEREGISAIADSPDEVRLRAREQLRQGASQIKLMGGGGVSSQYNPIESVQFTEPEIRAGVEAAENWGTYVAIHAYTPPAIRQAIAAGVRCIDHGQLIDEATAKLLVDKGLWWSLQPLSYNPDTFAAMSPVSQVKAKEVFAGTDRAYRLARKLGARTAWGSDILFNPVAAARQGSYLAMMTRWYTPAEALRMATQANGELLAMSGFSNPYPGKLGVVEQGAHADLLLVEGNPLANLDLVADPERSFRVIMKAGVVYKNTLT